jgi:uncharacterized membrane protein YiaA
MYRECVSEDILRNAFENITAVKEEMERCLQLHLFAAFMVVVGVYDIAINVRQFLRDQARALRQAE